MSSEKNIEICCFDIRYEISPRDLFKDVVNCKLGIMDIQAKCSGSNECTVTSQVSRTGFEKFTIYLDTLVHGTPESAKDCICDGNFAELLLLANEFKIGRLLADIERFLKGRIPGDYGRVMNAGANAESEYNTVVISSINGFLEHLLTQIKHATVDFSWLCRMIQRAQHQGKHVDSLLLSRLLLESTSDTSAPLFCFIDFLSLPLETQKALLQDPRSPSWVNLSGSGAPLAYMFLQQLEETRSTMAGLVCRVDELERSNNAMQSMFNMFNQDLISIKRDIAGSVQARRSVIQWLCKKERELGRRFVIVRKSYNDLYNILNPDLNPRDVVYLRDGVSLLIKFKEPILASSCVIEKTNGPIGCLILTHDDHEEQYDVCTQEGAQDKDKVTVQFGREVPVRSLLLRFAEVADLRHVGILKANKDNALRYVFVNHPGSVHNYFHVNLLQSDVPVPADTPGEVSYWDRVEGPRWIEFIIRGRINVSGYFFQRAISPANRNIDFVWSLRASNNRDLPPEQWTVLHRGTAKPAPDNRITFQTSLAGQTLESFMFFRYHDETPEVEEGLTLSKFDVDGTFTPQT